VDTLTGREIYRKPPGGPTENRAHDALAVGDYAVDLHNCTKPENLEPGELLSDIPPGFIYGQFQIPYGAFIPQVVDGFLPAEKNLGYTRLAAGATRLQPSTMVVGQAAGAIAALALKKYSPAREPRAVRVLDVQRELLNWGAAISIDTFTDIGKLDTHWAHAQLVSTYDIMTDFTVDYDPVRGPGFFLFEVNDSASRGDIAMALVRAFRIDTTFPGPPPQTFADVEPGHEAHLSVEALVRAGFTSLLDPQQTGKFFPDDALPREELAEWLAYAWWGNAVPAPPAQATFNDVPVGHPHRQAIEAVSKTAQLMMTSCGSVGSASYFCPSTSATRGELAQALAQVLFVNTAIWP
jgi:hypothetical protein